MSQRLGVDCGHIARAIGCIHQCAGQRQRILGRTSLNDILDPDNTIVSDDDVSWAKQYVTDLKKNGEQA